MSLWCNKWKKKKQPVAVNDNQRRRRYQSVRQPTAGHSSRPSLLIMGEWPPGRNAARETFGDEFSKLHVDTQLSTSHAIPLKNVDPVVTPIYHTSTRIMAKTSSTAVVEIRRRKNVEVIINELEGGAASLLYNSGLAALSAVFLEFLGSRTHMIALCPLYSGTYSFLTETMERFGVEITFINIEEEPDVIDALENSIRDATRIIFFETIGNPSMAVPDIAGTLKFAKKYKILSLVDATFSSPYNIQPIKLGADIVMHSCSKYIGGHTDTIGGVLTTATKTNWERLKKQQLTTGSALSPFDAALLARGLKTLALRVEKISNNALAVAKFLEGHKKVVRVIYPGLESHPGHRFAKATMKKFSGMIAFDVGDADDAIKLIENLRLIVHAVSLGGTESLIEHPLSISHGPQLMRGEIRVPHVAPGLLRFSVGVEDAKDIIADLDRALAQI
ncbi:unnamed protein product [Caenorhabditis auriculariae]|uniref:Gamma-cystathionase n=1 Tax=Caenorhabditis auriculariae TaxID=2777116 RepID=A0A8S1HJZ3_9PELO|nr:unnamed protein product [Caenorhabditis auriculariae]